ncbi:helix-turn-helix domain-containing protein [Paenibacillus chartarius]|uniref:Helix-turn-helix domain-containing protein n=1 Tax=Paenibacillus chartarius TaxID=747481 RepID=A0ABV6DRU3_9BACL
MKVFLVDDEKGIVTGLKKLIGRYIPECEVVGEAYNGLEGARLIQDREPDIVITDIRMPHADGLEMIAMLKDAGCPAEFILLSGYADFDYARKGMQLGVRYYMNKPVEEEELRDCVCKVMNGIREDRDKLQEVDELKQEVRSRILESTLRDIIDAGGDNSVYVGEWLRMAGIPEEHTRFVCALLEFDGGSGTLAENRMNPVFRHVDRALNRFRGVYRFRYAGSQLAIVVAHGEDIESGEIARSLNRLKEAVFRELQLSMTAGIGMVKDKAVEISSSFEEARHALSYKVIQGARTVISYPEIRSLTGERRNVPEELIDKLEAALNNMDEEKCISLIGEIFCWMEAEFIASPAELQLLCLNIVLSSVRKMSFQQLQQNDFLGRHILSLEGISRFRTLERLEQWMVEVIQGIIAFNLEHNISKKKDIIAEVKKYVAEHYNESISLAELAARYFINPYYLSQLFKQKTGDTYLNFLAQVRINKAKELLEKTNLKVYEISQTVGYSDTQHFSRLFEKLTGCKPSEYRRNSNV